MKGILILSKRQYVVEKNCTLMENYAMDVVQPGRSSGQELGFEIFCTFAN